MKFLKMAHDSSDRIGGRQKTCAILFSLIGGLRFLVGGSNWNATTLAKVSNLIRFFLFLVFDKQLFMKA